MKLRFVNTLLVTAAGLALLAGSAFAQSSDPTGSATRSISVVGTAASPAETAKAPAGEKTADISKDNPAAEAAPKSLPPIPADLTGADAGKDKSSVVVTPAPAEAAKDATAAVTPPPEAGKEKVAATSAPNGDAVKEKAVVVPPPVAAPPPAKAAPVHPKTADVEPAPSVRPKPRQFDHFERSGRYSGEYGHRRSYADHCEHFGY